jgi:hypothetical protein
MNLKPTQKEFLEKLIESIDYKYNVSVGRKTLKFNCSFSLLSIELTELLELFEEATYNFENERLFFKAFND